MSEDDNFVMQARREKLAALEAAGIAPFAYGFNPTHDASSALRALPEGVEQGADILEDSVAIEVFAPVRDDYLSGRG